MSLVACTPSITAGIGAFVVDGAPGEVHVERNNPPQVVALGVAVQAHVGPDIVVLVAPAPDDQVVHHLGQIEQIMDVDPPLSDG